MKSPKISNFQAMRPMRLIVGLSILAVAFVVFASLRGDDGGDGAGVLPGPSNAIAKAAERTQQEPGGHVEYQATYTSPDSEITMTGQGVYDAEKDRARITISFQDPESGALDEMEAVGDGTVMYIRSSLFGSLPDGADWMSIDFSLGEDLETPVPSGTDAAGELELLEHSTGGVQKIGREKVHGVVTTRYRGTVDVAENAQHLRDAGGEKIAKVVEEKGGPTQVEAWIDASGRVRRMRIVSQKPEDEGRGSSTTDLRMDFVDFGTIPEISVPDSSEVFDATSLAEDELGASDGG